MHSLHPKVSQLASRGWVDGREFGGGIRTGGLALSSADASCRLWRRLVLGLLLLILRTLSVLNPERDMMMGQNLLVLIVFAITTLSATTHTGLLIPLGVD